MKPSGDDPQASDKPFREGGRGPRTAEDPLNTVEGADAVDEKAAELIARNLRHVYNDVASEPVPDRFKALLEQLKRGGGDGGA